MCIYGEMVDVLAARGLYKAAYQLEVLWNALGEREPFTLFCGYASGALRRSEDRRRFSARFAQTHNHVHRKKDDLLAEFLLEQPRCQRASRFDRLLIHATIHACR